MVRLGGGTARNTGDGFSNETGFDSTMGFPGEGPPGSGSAGEAEVTEKPKISLYHGLAAVWMRQAHDARRTAAAEPRRPTRSLCMYYANVSSWSPKAREYVEQKVQADCDVMAFVETHLRGRDLIDWKNRIRKWGHRVSDAEAMRTDRSEKGTSGGCLVATSSSLASYGLGPLGSLAFNRGDGEKYWTGRSVRLAGRDLLVVTVYLPPGDYHQQARQDTLQDIGLLVRHVRGLWLVVGDWNMSPEDLTSTGFVAFVGAAVVCSPGNTCRQGKGSKIDFILADQALAGSINATVDQEVPWSPHYGLRITIHVERLDDKIRTWRRVQPIGDETEGVEGEAVQWHSGKPIWETRFQAGHEGHCDQVRMEFDSNAASERISGEYADFSAKAEVCLLSGSGQLPGCSWTSVGRGRARTWRTTCLAPRRPNAERYYCKAANDLARLRLLLQDLGKVRRRRRPDEDREIERGILRAAEPLLDAADRCIREDERKAGANETGVAVEVFQGIREELLGGAAVPVLKLAVAGSRIEKAVERAVRRAGMKRTADFRGWVQEHLPGGAGALHRVTNQHNANKCAVDEVFLDGGVLCTAEELMEHRVQVWTGLWLSLIHI